VSSTPRRRKSNARHYGDETRELILSAARKLFAANGLADTSMQDIADDAGVSRATVFNQFGSKQLVLDAITADSLTNYCRLLDDALADERTSTLDLLRTIFARMAAGLQANRRLYRHVFAEIRKVSLGLDAEGLSPGLRHEAFDRLVSLFARGQTRGDITRALPPEVLATAFDSLLSGAVTQWLQDGSGTSLDKLLAALGEVFLSGAARRP
jgi:AcrR family transcriptional regulator